MELTDFCTYLDWDSQFFDLRIARVTGHHLSPDSVTPILAWCEDQAIDCLYFLADSDDPQTVAVAEANGFHLVDVRVELGRAVNNGVNGSGVNGNGNGSIIRLCEPKDIPALRAIAGDLHCDSRFYFDQRFPRPLTRKLYEVWIERSCDGYADTVLVADSGGEAIGYCSCHLRGENRGQIGLFGVSADYHGQGVGSKLIREALHWFEEHGAQFVSVVTQGRNTAAQRLYQKHGFMTQSLQLWYHRWFS